MKNPLALLPILCLTAITVTACSHMSTEVTSNANSGETMVSATAFHTVFTDSDATVKTYGWELDNVNFELAAKVDAMPVTYTASSSGGSLA